MRGRVVGLFVLALAVPEAARAQVPNWSWEMPVAEETQAFAAPLVQDRLRAMGCYVGSTDGRLGPMTRGAIAAFQGAIGVEAPPVISEPLIDALLNRPVRCDRPGGPLRAPEPDPAEVAEAAAE